MIIKCPNCQAGMKIANPGPNMVVSCPKCKQRVEVPFDASAPATQSSGAEITANRPAPPTLPYAPPPYAPPPGYAPPSPNAAYSGMIPYKNGMALASYYLGIFSLIPCIGGILAILAIIFGFIGLSRVKQTPEIKGTAHAIIGIVGGGISLLGHALLLVIWLFAARF